MAETAAVTTAHAHARKAAEETHHTHWSQAADEHLNAATDYARAARSTSDIEALRILQLLERQHQRLARIIKSQDTIPDPDPVVPDVKTKDATLDQQNATPISSNEKTPATKQRPTTAPVTAARKGTQTRDASPSLARDIASRRGIPQPGRLQSSPAAQARASQLSSESHRGVGSVVAPKIPASIVDSRASLSPARNLKKTEEDESFAKFYANLTTGTMSKLSSVLAYAGLPLTEPVQPEPIADARSVKKRATANSDPDVKKLFSKAALAAIEDEHRQRGTLGHGFGPAESFYVVPQTGGTMPYAEIAKMQHQPLSGIGEEDDDSFVDAREAPEPSSPRHSRRASSNHAGRSSFGKPRTEEELELENTTLKHTLEQLAGRLANFEAHAQDASMAALTQSMAGLQPPRGGSGGADPSSQERIRHLEQQVEKQAEEEEKLRSLTLKQEKALRGWDRRYEKLKESAKAKEKAKRERVEKGFDDGVAAGDVADG